LKSGLKRDGVTWTYQATSGINYRFYRIEDGTPALEECLRQYDEFASEPITSRPIKHFNIGEEKAYGPLYKEVREKADFNRLRRQRSSLVREVEELFYGD
jgi:hypothetical protein